MNIRNAQFFSTKKLKKAWVDSPALDTDLLLAEAVKKSKEWLFIHPEAKLSPAAEKKFRALVRRRTRREPLAYILGRKEFYGLEFAVDWGALIPRPSTELLIDEALGLARSQKNAVIVDVGTGSGAIAVTLAKFLPQARVFATDVSQRALALARANAKSHGLSKRIKFLRGNLLVPLIKKSARPKNFKFQDSSFKIIVANLPYLPTSEWKTTWPEIRKYEPRRALDGGPDGLKYIRELLEQIKKGSAVNRRGTVILLEFDPEQTKKLSNFIHAAFPRAKFEIKKDLAGKNRLAVIKL